MPGPEGPQGPKGDPTAVPAYGATAGRTVFGYPDFSLTKTLPAGRYVLNASVDIAGYGSTSGYHGSETESLSLNSTVDHPGGALTLPCERSWNDAVVLDPSPTAVKVGSLG